MGPKIWLAVFIVLLMCNTSLQAQDVTLSIGDSSGGLGSHNNMVAVSLDNPDDFVRGLQLSIVDERDVLTCTGCLSNPDRAAAFVCLANEQPDGKCKIIVYTTDPVDLILRGNGPVFTIDYSVNDNVPPGGCSTLTPQEVNVAGANNLSLGVTALPGNFCVDSQDHFTPAAITGTQMELWGTFVINAGNAEVGDEVGIFVNNNCFGAYRVDTTGWYGSLFVYGDDPVTPEKDGAEAGDPLLIKIWDSSEGIERRLTVDEYTGPDPLTWIGDETAIVNIDASTLDDIDGDGVPNTSDNCPDIPNDQTNTDSDSYGDACDNCPFVDNEDQLDSNNNGKGNVCEVDGPCADIFPPEVTPGAGDCGDGVVDIFDVLESVDIILGKTANGCQMVNGDIPNGMPTYCGNPAGAPNCETDGIIDVFDLLVMRDKVLGEYNCCDYCFSISECAFDEDCDDGHPCTVDSCAPGEGCRHEWACLLPVYSTDFLETGNPGGWSGSLKTFDDAWTLTQSETVDVDIWLNDAPETIITAGFYILFDPAQVSVVNVEGYDDTTNPPGPWDADFVSSFEAAPGQWVLSVGNFGCVTPDGDEDIIMARVTFQCNAPGDAGITISTIPGFDTVVGCSGLVYDQSIVPSTIVIQQVYNLGHLDYCRDLGPCAEGEGDCDSDGECESGLICFQDVGTYYGWDISIDVCQQPEWCPWAPGDLDYCRGCGPCAEGEGDCDSDDDCESGLVCVQDVGDNYGWDSFIDVCQQPEWCPWAPGDLDYCRDCGPCVAGEGDCDGDGECEGGLVCAQDVGDNYGWDSFIDVCQQPEWCPWDAGHANYCRDCGPCVAGEGDCDGDGECEGGLVCAQDVGDNYGWDPSIDVCQQAQWCPWDAGHANYCRDCGPCVAGEGDCDGDGECESGLVCAQDVGDNYGWDPSIDVCQQPQWCPWDAGHANYCRDCGPCVAGEGDCDGDGECESGLVCAQDVGDNYGWDQSIDVCE